MAKTDVNGDNADPAVTYLRTYSDLKGKNIPWNFAKFLVNADGDVVAFYSPPRSPQTIKKDIETLLG